jgi:hypothetical protein
MLDASVADNLLSKRSELLQKIQEQTARIRELEAALARCTCGQAGAG